VRSVLRVVGAIAALSSVGLACNAPHQPTEKSADGPLPSTAPPLVSAPAAPATATPFVPARVVDNDEHAMATHDSYTAITTPTLS
jgi:hypothetical protein